MAYLNSIPQPTDDPSVTQAQLLANFQAIKQLVDVNHGTFSDANEGKHKHVSFPEQAASPATAVNELGLFSRQSALTGVAELCLRKENNGAVYEMSCLASATGWTRLPSGILLKWGTTTANGLTTITLPVAATIPVYTTIFSIQLTNGDTGVADSNTAIRFIDAVPASFRVYGSPRITSGAKNVGFNYLVIGI
jgi:hypothetical protein